MSRKTISRLQNMNVLRKSILLEGNEELPTFLKSKEEREEVTPDIWTQAETEGGEPDDFFKNEIFKYLDKLKTEGKLDEPVDESFTPLTFAITNNLPYLVNELLEIGADPNKPNAFNEYPVNLSAQVEDFNMTKALVDAGADIEQEDERGYNNLLIALEKQSPIYLDDIVSNYPKLLHDMYQSRKFEDAIKLSDWSIKYTDKGGRSRVLKARKYLETIAQDLMGEIKHEMGELRGKSFTTEELLALLRNKFMGYSLGMFKAELGKSALKLVKTGDKSWEIRPSVGPGSEEPEETETEEEPKRERDPEKEPVIIDTEDVEPANISVEVPIEPGEGESETTEETSEEEAESEKEEKTTEEPVSEPSEALSPEELSIFLDAFDEFRVGRTMSENEWGEFIKSKIEGETFKVKVAAMQKALAELGRRLLADPDGKGFTIVELPKPKKRKAPFRVIGK